MDQRLFFLINRQWAVPALDRIMAAASSFDLWLPVIVVLVLLTAWLGRVRGRLCLLTLGLTLVVGDGLVDNPLKHAIHRLRPFQAMAGVRQVDLARRARPRLLALFQPLQTSITAGPLVAGADHPFPGRSFPSSHVVNNFCAATVLAFFYRRRGALYFLPAGLVAYSRVYVGAHWPSDVTVSAVLGVGVALCVLAGMQLAVGRWGKRMTNDEGRRSNVGVSRRWKRASPLAPRRHSFPRVKPLPFAFPAFILPISAASRRLRHSPSRLRHSSFVIRHSSFVIPMSPVRSVLLFLLLLTGLRLAYVGRVELSPDEAYYQMWSERLDWAYYSKGPGVAAAIRAGTDLFGVNEFGVRCFSPLLALGTSLLLFSLARRCYGDGAAVWSVVLTNVTPLFTAGSLLMTIDALSVFFWSAALLTCWLAVEESAAAAARLGWWLLTGLAVGLGFLAKYTNAMELAGIVLALWLVRRWRREFRRPGVYLMLATAAAVGSPPFFWNARHAWITLSHLHDRGRLGSAFDRPLGEFGKFAVGHFGVYSPLIFAGMMVGIVWGWRRGKLRLLFWRRGRRNVSAGLDPGGVRARFLLATGLPLLAMYTLLSFKTAGEPNWTAPAFLSLSVLATGLWHERARASRAAGFFCVAALAVGLVMSLVLLDTDNLRQLGVPWPYARDPTARLLGWRTTARCVEGFRADEERQLNAPVFLIANRYQLAAELNFYLADKRIQAAGHPAVYLPESQSIETQFSLWPGYDQVPPPPPRPEGALPTTTAEEEFKGIQGSPFVGKSALYITDDEHRRRVPSAIESGFEECNLVAQFEIQRRGLPLRHLRVYACFSYKGLDL